MKTRFRTRRSTVARAQTARAAAPLTLSAALGDKLTTLYALAQRSDHVFGSPLGPFYHNGLHHHLPRFVYFGPHTSEESPRIAFLGGLDSRDLRPTLALMLLIERLAIFPGIGQSLHLAFFPLVDVLGHLRAAPDRDLSAQNWANPPSPELALIAKDSLLRSYHAFVRVESAPADDTVTLRLRVHGAAGTDFPLLSSEDTDPYPVRWEIENLPAPQGGPLSLGDDLPFEPLDLTLRVPVGWSPEYYSEAVASILKHFIVSYRSLLAYGQGL